MMTNCEQKIMDVLLPEPFKQYSIRKLSELTETSYALTHESIKTLIEKKAINAEKLGNSLICRLNLSAEPKLLSISSLIHSEKFLNKVRFGFLIKELEKGLAEFIYILVLFGSHAKGKAKKDSDIDLLFVVQNDIEPLKKKIRAVLLSTNIKVDFEVITAQWLLEMFEKKNSLGSEVLETSIVLHGAEQYYSLVKHYDQKRRH